MGWRKIHRCKRCESLAIRSLFMYNFHVNNNPRLESFITISRWLDYYYYWNFVIIIIMIVVIIIIMIIIM